MHFVLNGLFLLAAIKWGDWKHWREYYPTILFFVGGDLLKNALLHDHRMWTYQEVYFGQSILVGHLAINLLIMLIAYPSTILMYLGRLPKSKVKKFYWVLLWVVLYSGIEFMNLRFLNLIEHHYNWNMGWSVLFNIIMFSFLFVHYKKPLLAWLLSFVWLIFLCQWFDIPSSVLK